MHEYRQLLSLLKHLIVWNTLQADGYILLQYVIFRQV